MKKLIATIALSVTLAGCGTSLTYNNGYNNGDVNWKAVAITSGTLIAGILLCNEFCEIGHNVQVKGGDLDVNANVTYSEEDSQRLREDLDYIREQMGTTEVPQAN